MKHTASHPHKRWREEALNLNEMQRGSQKGTNSTVCYLCDTPSAMAEIFLTSTAGKSCTQSAAAKPQEVREDDGKSCSAGLQTAAKLSASAGLHAWVYFP